MAFNHIHPLILECDTYEDYVDNFVTIVDLRYLRNINTCRQIVMLNYNPSIEVYSKRDFWHMKQFIEEQLNPLRNIVKDFSHYLNTTDDVLIELASRERPNLQKNISTIIFMCDYKKSGFIDYEDSLQQARQKSDGAVDWVNVFRERVKLSPKQNDLSYCNFRTNKITYNNTANYLVMHHAQNGVVFVHRGDHKKIFICQDLEGLGHNNISSKHFSNTYGYVIFFDHIVRKKM